MRVKLFRTCYITKWLLNYTAKFSWNKYLCGAFLKKWTWPDFFETCSYRNVLYCVFDATLDFHSFWKPLSYYIEGIVIPWFQKKWSFFSTFSLWLWGDCQRRNLQLCYEVKTKSLKQDVREMAELCLTVLNNVKLLMNFALVELIMKRLKSRA